MFALAVNHSEDGLALWNMFWAHSGQGASQLKRDQFPSHSRLSTGSPSRAGLKIRKKRMVFEEAPGVVSAGRHDNLAACLRC